MTDPTETSPLHAPPATLLPPPRRHELAYGYDVAYARAYPYGYRRRLPDLLTRAWEDEIRSQRDALVEPHPSVNLVVSYSLLVSLAACNEAHAFFTIFGNREVTLTRPLIRVLAPIFDLKWAIENLPNDDDDVALDRFIAELEDILVLRTHERSRPSVTFAGVVMSETRLHEQLGNILWRAVTTLGVKRVGD